MLSFGCSCGSQLEIFRNVLFIILSAVVVLYVTVGGIMKWVYDLEIQLKSQTSPEHKALTYEYYRRLMEARKTQEEIEKLDKMFKDE